MTLCYDTRTELKSQMTFSIPLKNIFLFIFHLILKVKNQKQNLFSALGSLMPLHLHHPSFKYIFFSYGIRKTQISRNV